jgi:hypothetical protein
MTEATETASGLIALVYCEPEGRIVTDVPRGSERRVPACDFDATPAEAAWLLTFHWSVYQLANPADQARLDPVLAAWAAEDAPPEAEALTVFGGSLTMKDFAPVVVFGAPAHPFAPAPPAEAHE